MADQRTFNSKERDDAGKDPPPGVSRRRVIEGAVAIGSLLAVGSSVPVAAGGVERAADTSQRRLRFKGINYDVGTNYQPELQPAVWHSNSMQSDIRAIRDDLHCNSIGIHGTDIKRLEETAVTALENNLHVWLQPRLFDSTPEEMLSHLSEAAGVTEQLRKQYLKVILNVGCETSLFTHGFIPGASYLERIANFRKYASELPSIRQRLDAFLKRAREVSRAKFTGPLTYGSGPWEWEGIDWMGFDFVGLDHYMNESNAGTYADVLRKFARFNKPVIVLEFGCCTYEGAEKAGGMGWDIIDYSKSKPELKGPYVRSEQVQSEYIGRSLDIFEAERIEGAFVYLFANHGLLHSADPRYDLDMASYGVVKLLNYASETGRVEWEPKLAFAELGRRYSTRGAEK